MNVTNKDYFGTPALKTIPIQPQHFCGFFVMASKEFLDGAGHALHISKERFLTALCIQMCLADQRE